MDMAHHTLIAEHQGGRKTSYYFRKRFNWTSMIVHAYDVVKNCIFCALERIKNQKYATELKLFPDTEPLSYVSNNVLGSLMKENNGNTGLLVKTGRISKLTKTALYRTQTVQEKAAALTKHCFFLYGPPSEHITDDRKH